MFDNYLGKVIGENIYNYRIEFGYSQEELASLCNCSQAYISMIEHSERVPSLEKLLVFSEIFKIHLKDILNPRQK